MLAAKGKPRLHCDKLLTAREAMPKRAVNLGAAEEFSAPLFKFYDPCLRGVLPSGRTSVVPSRGRNPEPDPRYPKSKDLHIHHTALLGSFLQGVNFSLTTSSQQLHVPKCLHTGLRAALIPLIKQLRNNMSRTVPRGDKSRFQWVPPRLPMCDKVCLYVAELLSSSLLGPPCDDRLSASRATASIARNQAGLPAGYIALDLVFMAKAQALPIGVSGFPPSQALWCVSRRPLSHPFWRIPFWVRNIVNEACPLPVEVSSKQLHVAVDMSQTSKSSSLSCVANLLLF